MEYNSFPCTSILYPHFCINVHSHSTAWTISCVATHSCRVKALYPHQTPESGQLDFTMVHNHTHSLKYFTGNDQWLHCNLVRLVPPAGGPDWCSGCSTEWMAVWRKHTYWEVSWLVQTHIPLNVQCLVGAQPAQIVACSVKRGNVYWVTYLCHNHSSTGWFPVQYVNQVWPTPPTQWVQYDVLLPRVVSNWHILLWVYVCLCFASPLYMERCEYQCVSIYTSACLLRFIIYPPHMVHVYILQTQVRECGIAKSPGQRRTQPAWPTYIPSPTRQGLLAIYIVDSFTTSRGNLLLT